MLNGWIRKEKSHYKNNNNLLELSFQIIVTVKSKYKNYIKNKESSYEKCKKN